MIVDLGRQNEPLGRCAEMRCLQRIHPVGD
jgi:hypothetical protein